MAQYDLCCNFDGGCWPNPGGRATWAFVLKNRAGQIVIEASGVIRPGKTSNNIAEYVAVLKAMEAIEAIGAAGWRVLIRGDSQIVINKLASLFPSRGLCRQASFQAQDKYRFLVNEMGIAIDRQWVPREENAYADALGRQ